MKFTKSIITFAIVAFSLTAAAKVDVNLTLSRTTYMQFEPIYACVTLRNDSGRAILFGNNPRLQGFVLFDVRDSSGKQIPKIPGAEINSTGLVLQPGQIKNMIIPVSKYYKIDKPGIYKIAAFVSHNLLQNEYQSEFRMIKVETGVKTWERTVGIPNLDDESKEKVQERTYSLRTLTEARTKYYYLVVEDAKRVYGVMRVGQLVGREEPQIEIDMLSRIHLLMPLSPRVFHYLSFSLDGININNSYWKTAETIPRLHRDNESGKIICVGGAPAKPGVDFKDPNEGKLTTSKLLDDDSITHRMAKKPRAAKDRGIVDLGKSLEE